MAIKGYNFYLDGVKQNPFPQANPTFTYTGLTSGTAHNFTCEAVDFAGNVSDVSDPANVTTNSYTFTDSPMSDTDVAAVEDIVKEQMAKYPAAQGAILKISGAKGYYQKAYGNDWVRNVSVDDHFRIGSTTKMFTSTLILREIERGHLSFDDKLSQFVSGVKNGDKITVKHLLMHQSGIPDYNNDDSTNQQAYILSPLAFCNVLGLIRGYGSFFEPGTQFRYSNSGYFLLGQILIELDKVYGTSRPIEQIFQEEILTPWELTETSYPTLTTLPAPYMNAKCPNFIYQVVSGIPIVNWLLATGLFGAATQFFTNMNPSYGNTAGALISTISDLHKFTKRLVMEDDLLGPAMKQLREETWVTYANYVKNNEYDGPGWMGYGFGWLQWGSWIGHTGNAAGYCCMSMTEMNTGTTVTFVMNELSSILTVIETFYRIAYYLMPETTLHVVPTRVRNGGGIGTGEDFGQPGVYVYHAPGDIDGKNQIDLKVPYYI